MFLRETKGFSPETSHTETMDLEKVIQSPRIELQGLFPAFISHAHPLSIAMVLTAPNSYNLVVIMNANSHQFMAIKIVVEERI